MRPASWEAVGKTARTLLFVLLVALTFVLKSPVTTLAQVDSRISPQVVATVGHTGDVLAAVFSPDNRTALSAGDDRTVKLWEVNSGRLIRDFSGHSESVEFAGFIANGAQIVSADRGGVVFVWDTLSGNMLQKFRASDETNPNFALSYDGHLVSANREFALWDVRTGRQIRNLGRFRDFGVSGSTIATSPISNAVLIGNHNGGIALWDLRTGEAIQRFAGHSDEVTRIAFSRDGKLAVSESKDGTLKVWDVSSGAMIRSLNTGKTQFRTPAIFISSADDLVGSAYRVWALSTGRLLRETKESPIALSADGKISLTRKDESRKKIGLAHIGSGRLLRTLGEGAAERVFSLASPHDGSIVAATSPERPIRLWDLQTGRLVKNIGGKSALPVAISQDAKILISGSQYESADDFYAYNRLKAWDLASGREIRSFPLRGREENILTSVAIASNATTAFTLREGSTLESWNIATGQNVRTIQLEFGRSMALSPDGASFATAHENSIVVWNSGTGRKIRTIKANPDSTSVAFSPDSKSLLSGAEDKTVKLWEVASGRLLRSFDGHASRVTSVAFSPDRRTIASSSWDTIIRLWNVESGETLKSLRGHQGGVNSVIFSEVGSRVISAGEDGTVRIWDVVTGSLLASLVAFDNGEWVTITPEGFFDASESGAKLLSVVRGLEVYSIDQFYRSLYRPDLVRQKLAGDPSGLVREAALKLDLVKAVATGAAPQVTIRQLTSASDGQYALLQAEVADTGGGIGKVEWRINGVVLGLDKARGGERSLMLQKQLALAPGENRIEIVAYNARGLIASNPVQIRVTSNRPQSSRTPKLYVLAVGIDAYEKEALRLRFAVSDARGVGAALQRVSAKLYEEVIVTNLLDAEATATKLDEAFGKLAELVTPDDVFVFFLSGHGRTLDGKFYFIPQDYRYGEAEIPTHAISQDQIQDWFVRISAHRALLLTDACESGSLTEDRLARTGIEQFTATQHLTQSIGRAVLAATTDNTPAAEGYGEHGVFTYAVLDGLSQADANNDGLIDVKELGLYVRQKVPTFTWGAWKRLQVPQMSVSGSTFSLVSRAVQPLVAAVAQPGTTVLASATHTVAAPTMVRQFGSGAAMEIFELNAGSKVSVLQRGEEWSLVARDGQAIGYVKSRALAQAQ